MVARIFGPPNRIFLNRLLHFRARAVLENASSLGPSKDDYLMGDGKNGSLARHGRARHPSARRFLTAI